MNVWQYTKKKNKKKPDLLEEIGLDGQRKLQFMLT